MEALADGLRRASKASSNFDWSRYLPQSRKPVKTTHVALNPYLPDQADCKLGCPGFLCDSMDACQQGYVCKNNVCEKCTKGCPGMQCDAYRNLCQEKTRCVDGICQECAVRADSASRRTTCELDEPSRYKSASTDETCGLDEPFTQPPICNYCDGSTKECRGSPCVRAVDCDADEFCDWGLCRPCTSGCLGMACKSSRDCKTGNCNAFDKCDYPSGVGKGPMRAEDYVGRRGPGYFGPRYQNQGPSKPRDNVARVVVPVDEVKQTGSTA